MFGSCFRFKQTIHIHLGFWLLVRTDFPYHLMKYKNCQNFVTTNNFVAHFHERSFKSLSFSPVISSFVLDLIFLLDFFSCYCLIQFDW